MRHTDPHASRRRQSTPQELSGTAWALSCVLAVFLGVVAGGPWARAYEAVDGPAETGKAEVIRVVRVRLPIDAATLQTVRRVVDSALDSARTLKSQPVLIFEMDAPLGQEKHSRTTEFGAAYDLADYLSSPDLREATTVAFVPRTIEGHAFLPVLACDEIVMASDAEIGASAEMVRRVTPAMLGLYREMAARRKNVPAEVAIGLIDPSRKVLAVETEISIEYVDEVGLESLRERRTIQSISVLFEAGQPGRLSGANARKRGFIGATASNLRDLARVLALPPTSITEDLALGRDWSAVRVDLKGPITSESARKVQQLIDDAIRLRDVNFVCLWIDSPGGAPDASMQLAAFLILDLDPGKVRTVAYLDGDARADAALVALACDQIVLREGSVLGGEGNAEFRGEGLDEAVDFVRDIISPGKSRSWSLPVAMIDPERVVRRFDRVDGPGYHEFFCEAEHQAQTDPAAWKPGASITTEGEPFSASGSEALDYWLAKAVVQGFPEFKALYNLDDDPYLLEPGWADFLVEALAHPGTAGFLLMIGILGVYVEMHSPGLSVGGFVAAVCFLLFFWSGFLGGTAGWLEAILFVGGVSCLLLEVFVIPGFGIFGLGGGAMILASLVLATQTFMVPRNSYQFGQLINSLSVVALAVAGAMIAAVFLSRYLPQMPLLGRIVLQPSDDEERERLERRERLVNLDELIGTRGRTITQLTPSGKARVGDQTLDVLSPGDLIGKGEQIVIVEIQGNRVVVERAS